MLHSKYQGTGPVVSERNILFFMFSLYIPVNSSKHYRIGQSISKRYQKTAKQNSFKCIREVLPNTRVIQ